MIFSVGDYAELFSGAKDYYWEQHLEQLDSELKNKQKVDVRFQDKEVTETVYKRHLEGKVGLALSPIDGNNQCKFGVIDIDCYEANYTKVVRSIYSLNLPLIPIRSKSGGLHVYMFLRKAISAKALKDVLEKIAELLGLRSLYGEKCEIFPKQVRLNPGQHGNCITLPYFGAASDSEKPLTYAYTETFEAMGLKEFVEYASSSMCSLAEVEAILSELPVSDGPPCLQKIRLSFPMQENSGRNNALFTAAVYFKKKYDTAFGDYVVEYNNAFEEPLDEAEVSTIIASVGANEYNYKCSAEPCRTLCDKKACANRKYGVGMVKGYFTGFDYGKMYRVMAAKPYYLWELRPMGTDGPYKQVRFDDESQLIDQRYFSKMCIRSINLPANRVDDVAWNAILAKALSSIEEITIPVASDTSEVGRLKTALTKYLTRYKMGVNKPYMITLSSVYREGDNLYFTIEGLEKFLRTEGIKMTGENMREALLNLGCKEGVLKYKTMSGKDAEIECWIKQYDEKIQTAEEVYEDALDEDRKQIESILEDIEEGVSDDEEISF